MKKRGTFNYVLYVLAGFIVFNIIWYACASILQLKALPQPLEVYAGYPKAIENGIMLHLAASLRRVFLGLLISLAIAIIIGISMGYNRAINRILGPLLYFTYPVPKLTLLPIVLLIFGIGETSKILIIILIIVFQLILSIRDAVVNIPRDDYGVLVSLRATNFDKIKHITFPAILPDILSSLRVSLGIAMSALFFTETIGTKKGLGAYINDCWMRIDYIQMYFGIFLLSLAGFLIFLILDLLEKYLCKWKSL